jgi:hypothetical protein
MDLSQFLLEVAKQVPALVVLMLIVDRFLKALNGVAARFEQVEDKRSESLETLGDSCHAFQRDVQAKNEAVMGKVVTALDRNTESLGKNTYALDRAMKHFGER